MLNVFHSLSIPRTAKVLALLAVASATSTAQAEMLIVQGSTTFSRVLMEPHQRAIESAAGHEIVVIPNKSLPGLKALLDGSAQLAMISAPFDRELEVLSKEYPTEQVKQLRAFEVWNTRVAIAIHPSNPIRRASLDTISRILSGDVQNWQKVGGPDRAIRTVLVGAGGGVTAAVEAQLLKPNTAITPNIIYVKTPVQLVQVVEQEPGAMGFAQLALVLQRRLPELVTDEPILQSLSLVTRGEPTPAMKSLIEATRRAAEKLM
jgi:phosphate transport system substrate-binding protein